ncbi:MAG: tetratricopeptide repeat protein [Byssovorax sp.]
MAERDDRRPPSSRDVAGEDFLFHLYRGSELLQDNRVHDAKAELEHALSLQPSDPKGQDLLGIVYFRLGLYPRAIAIFERLIQLHPEALEPRINLALSYLKTGQPSQARFELERVVERNPAHSRAWGYLGLAFQRLGDYERAGHAFSAGGHDGMARRLVELALAAAASLSLRPPSPPAPAPEEAQEVAAAALADAENEVTTFRQSEIERLRGQRASQHDTVAAPPMPSNAPSMNLPPLALSRQPTGTWAAVEAGHEPIAPPPPRMPQINGPTTTPFGPEPSLAALNAVASLRPHNAHFAAGPPSGPARSSSTGPRRASVVARESLLVFPRDLRIGLHTSGVVLVQATSGFAARLESVRSLSYAAGYGTSQLLRRTRGRTGDAPLGGPLSPIVEITGKGEIVLGPARGQRLEPILIEDEPFYLREDALVGLETSVAYENGSIAVGDGEAIGMVQLRGPGAVVAQLPEGTTALEIIEARATAVRAVLVLGWIGRLLPRALLTSEAPAGARGFVSFTGEGLVLVDGR